MSISRFPPRPSEPPYRIVTSSTRPSSPFKGLTIYEEDTQRTLIYNGSEWQKPWNMPWGRVGETAETGSNITVPDNTATTVQSVDVGVVAGRKYRVEGFIKLQASGADRKPLARLRDSSTFWDMHWVTIHSGDNAEGTASFTYEAAETKTETFSVTVQSTAGGNVVVAKANQWDAVRITVDDLGPI